MGSIAAAMPQTLGCQHNESRLADVFLRWPGCAGSALAGRVLTWPCCLSDLDRGGGIEIAQVHE